MFIFDPNTLYWSTDHHFGTIKQLAVDRKPEVVLQDVDRYPTLL